MKRKIKTMDDKFLKRYEFLNEYNPHKDNNLIAEGLIEENFKSFLVGLASLIGVQAMGQNPLADVKNIIDNQKPVTINGKSYDTPQEFQALQKGFQTLNTFINDPDVQTFLQQSESGNLAGAPPEVVDFYQNQGRDPAVNQLLNLVASLQRGTSYNAGGSRYNLTGIKLKEIKAQSGMDVSALLRQGYDVTNVEYKQIVDTVTQFAPDTLVTEFTFGNQNLFRENDYVVADTSALQGVLDSIIAMSKEGKIISEITIFGSASHIPTELFGGSNENLALNRACSVANTLKQNGVVVDISTSSAVQGPEWKPNATREERMSLYHPYQYVKIGVFYTVTETAQPSQSAPASGEAEMSLSKLVPIATKKGGTPPGKDTNNHKPIKNRGQNSCPKF